MLQKSWLNKEYKHLNKSVIKKNILFIIVPAFVVTIVPGLFISVILCPGIVVGDGVVMVVVEEVSAEVIVK